MCVYQDCPFLCVSKKQHHFRFAKMRRNKSDEIVKTPSPKVNWNIVEQLKIGHYPIRKKTDNNNEIE